MKLELKIGDKFISPGKGMVEYEVLEIKDSTKKRNGSVKVKRIKNGKEEIIEAPIDLILSLKKRNNYGN